MVMETREESQKDNIITIKVGFLNRVRRWEYEKKKKK